MSNLDRANAGRRVELVSFNDQYSTLKAGDKGTYEFELKQPSFGFTQHSIKWDNGSSIMLTSPPDVFRFIKEPEK